MNKRLLNKVLPGLLVFLIILDMTLTQMAFERGYTENNPIAKLILASILGQAGLWVSSIFLILSIIGTAYINRNNLNSLIGKTWLAGLVILIIGRVLVIYNNYILLS